MSPDTRPGRRKDEHRPEGAAHDSSRRFLDTLIGNLPGIVYRCDNSPRWPFSFVSEGCRDITGWSSEDFLERRVDFGELILPEDQHGVWDEVQVALRERRPYLLTYRVRSRDGRQRWLWEKGCGIFGPDGELEHLEGVMLDISQQKALEQQLLQAHKMEAVGRLAGGVAHDFNNLLTAILGYADMLAAQLPEGTEVREHARQVMRAAQRAADLTRKLLSFARKQVVEARAFDLSELVLSVDPLLRRLIGEDVELVTLPGRDVGPVEADPGHVEQVLVNLAVNARQAMPQGGTLSIETAELELDAAPANALPDAAPGRFGVLVVRDTGIGMDADTLEHLFEPFYTTKDKGEGTGLGLATCHGLVHQAGGFITVESVPGRGTSFRVHLPRASADSAEPLPRPPAEQTRGGSETVLLVEDEPLVHQVAEESLRGLGYRVLGARSGIEALEIARRNVGAIDLLITDLVLPRMSGHEVARRVLEIQPDLPVLYVSGYAGEDAPRASARASGSAFLAKPFTPRGLGSAVRLLLDRAIEG